MQQKKTQLTLLLFVTLLVLSGVGVWYYHNAGKLDSPLQTIGDQVGKIVEPHELSIEYLKKNKFPGSKITIEETLTPGINYKRYVATYQSEGYTIYALLTMPNGEPPEGGFPVIVFNHGYIPPAEYKTTERYIAYTDAFSRNGYIVFKPDYRGHGKSEGQAEGGYGSNAYTVDVMNATASIKRYENVNPDKIGMWGHSMGGYITLRNMVAREDIKAGVIWAGVVGSYEDLFERWRRRGVPTTTPSTRGGGWRESLSLLYGSPEDNPAFWDSLSANSYLADISGPVQIHHGTADTSVPVEFSEELQKQLESVGQESELYLYQGDDHNISANLYTALQRSVDFFDEYVK